MDKQNILLGNHLGMEGGRVRGGRRGREGRRKGGSEGGRVGGGREGGEGGRAISSQSYFKSDLHTLSSHTQLL